MKDIDIFYYQTEREVFYFEQNAYNRQSRYEFFNHRV